MDVELGKGISVMVSWSRGCGDGVKLRRDPEVKPEACRPETISPSQQEGAENLGTTLRG